MPKHYVWPVKDRPVTVFFLGEETVHPDLASAVRYYNPWALSLSKDRSCVLRGGSFLCPGNKVRFRDGYGHDIPPDEVMSTLAPAMEPRPYSFFLNRFGKSGRFRFRDGTVPGTGKRSGGHYYRRMRTAQEIRESAALERDDDAVEHGVRARPSRNHRNLTTCWDDIPIERDERSWKRFRRTRWKCG